MNNLEFEMFFNQFKTVLLLGILSSLFLGIGYVAGGSNGMTIALIMAFAMNFVTYFWSDKLVLMMYGAKPLDTQKHKFVHDIMHDLCSRGGMPMPKLWYIDSDMANAFATGRNPDHASVAVTRGILNLLDERELRGVLAHELSHVKNRDILIGTVAAVIASAIGYVAFMIRWSVLLGGSRDREGRDNTMAALVMAIFVPLIATLIQLAISRSREYLADETGARCCNDPLALASALEKLHHGVKFEPQTEPESAAQASMASLFIVYPFSGRGILNLLSTHPPMEKRIARLRNMVNK
jgi:heat shock protein HtpX